MVFVVFACVVLAAAAAANDAELAADAIPGDVEQAAQNAEQANAEQAIADLQERQEILGDFILRCFRVVYSALASTAACTLVCCTVISIVLYVLDSTLYYSTSIVY